MRFFHDARKDDIMRISPVRPSVYFISLPTQRISMKFGVGGRVYTNGSYQTSFILARSYPWSILAVTRGPLYRHSASSSNMFV
jgi:hypothetical protein